MGYKDLDVPESLATTNNNFAFNPLFLFYLSLSHPGQSGCPNGGGVAVAGGGGGAPPEAKVTLWTKGSMRLEGMCTRMSYRRDKGIGHSTVNYFFLFTIYRYILFCSEKNLF